ncbi:hypothetical protein CEXT_141341 [Caerostris extrusa]|uniref:Uncharacterized protein n=1 Tax=Caerostris extrusa TaxID=172846 RepID=A0AAV4WAU4_CAEEX|nr:hypothetical protein CEXT_141341 [Caerostris extrusa]
MVFCVFHKALGKGQRTCPLSLKNVKTDDVLHDSASSRRTFSSFNKVGHYPAKIFQGALPWKMDYHFEVRHVTKGNHREQL